MAYSYDDMLRMAQQAGFQGNSAGTMAAIAMAESGGNPAAINKADPGGSYGLTQINGGAHGLNYAMEAINPNIAFQHAHDLYERRGNFNDWSTYKSGEYAKFLNGQVGGRGAVASYASPVAKPMSSAEGENLLQSYLKPQTPGTTPSPAPKAAEMIPIKMQVPPVIMSSTDPGEALLQSYMKPVGTGVKVASSSSSPGSPVQPTSQANAGISGFFNGLPVVGPYALGGLQKLTAYGQSQATGQPYGQALSDIQKYQQASSEEYPKTELAGNVAGGIAGTAPLMMAAPTAFGLGSGSLFARSALSGLSGGAIQAADTTARGGNLADVERSGALGVGFGALAPGAGQLIGNGINWGANVLTRTAPGIGAIADTLRATGMSPMKAQAEISRLGPNATLADVSPSLRAEAGALTASGGVPTDTLTRFFGNRARGADQRVNDVVTTFLGPRPDLSAAEDAIKTSASSVAAPHYNAARAAPLPVDATPVVSYIDRELQDAKGGVAQTLQMARKLVTKPSPLPGVTVPEDNAQRLLNARQALDDFIEKRGDQETSAGRNAIRQAATVRSQIDQIVKMDPNIAAGDAAFASKISEAKALESGTTIFNPSMRLEDIKRSVASATPGQLDAMRQGALSAIHEKLGGVTGDYAAARNMFAKADINRAKLDALFPNSGKVLDAVEGEIAQRGTEHAVTQNSLTEQRRAVARKYSISENHPASIAPALIGQFVGGPPAAIAAQGAKMSYDAFVKSILRAQMDRVRSGAASALATSGPGVSPLMDQINRAYRTGPAVNTLLVVDQSLPIF